MKKIVIATIFACLTGAAFAGDNVAGIEYKYEDPRGAGTAQQGYEFTFGTKVLKDVGVDLKGENMYTNGNGTNTSKIEVGVTPSVNFNYGLTGYVRGAVGERFIPGERFSYYSVEPGVRYALNDKAAVKVGYRFRDAFDNTANQYLTRTWRLGAEYAVTKDGTVFAGFDRQEGDNNNNVVSVGYKIGF